MGRLEARATFGPLPAFETPAFARQSGEVLGDVRRPNTHLTRPAQGDTPPALAASISRSGGISPRQRSTACGQRRWKWQPRRRRQRAREVRRWIGLEADDLVVREHELRHAVEQRARVGVPRVRHRSRSRRPISTIRPRYMMATRSETWRTTPRSWLMNSMVRPSSRRSLQEQVDDLRLDRHVERGDRLVADQHVGLHRERARDRDALALAAGELVREAARAAAGSRPTAVEPAARHRLLRLGRGDQPMRERTLGDRVADAHARIERGERVLEHHLDARRALARRGRAITGSPAMRAVPGRRRQDAGDDAAERGLAAAGFADQARALRPCAMRERYAVDAHARRASRSSLPQALPRSARRAAARGVERASRRRRPRRSALMQRPPPASGWWQR